MRDSPTAHNQENDIRANVGDVYYAEGRTFVGEIMVPLRLRYRRDHQQHSPADNSEPNQKSG
jgi:hypothetical protein